MRVKFKGGLNWQFSIAIRVKSKGVVNSRAGKCHINTVYSLSSHNLYSSFRRWAKPWVPFSRVWIRIASGTWRAGESVFQWWRFNRGKTSQLTGEFLQQDLLMKVFSWGGDEIHFQFEYSYTFVLIYYNHIT